MCSVTGINVGGAPTGAFHIGNILITIVPGCELESDKRHAKSSVVT